MVPACSHAGTITAIYAPLTPLYVAASDTGAIDDRVPAAGVFMPYRPEDLLSDVRVRVH